MFPVVGCARSSSELSKPFSNSDVGRPEMDKARDVSCGVSRFSLATPKKLFSGKFYSHIKIQKENKAPPHFVLVVIWAFLVSLYDKACRL